MAVALAGRGLVASLSAAGGFDLRFELAPGQSIRPDATFVLRPEPGVKVILTPRSGLA